MSTRGIGLVIVASTLGTPLLAQEIRATFIGNMAFHITDGERALLSDFPYQSGAFGYMHWERGTVPSGDAPLCLVTHSHRDHFVPDPAPDFCGLILGPADTQQAGGPPRLEPIAEVHWEGITIRPIATPHVSLEHYSYIVEWAGVRMYFTGDTEETGALLSARDIDVAFVSPWLLRTVEKQGGRIDARRVVVYHHRDREAVVVSHDRIVPRKGQVLRLGRR